MNYIYNIPSDIVKNCDYSKIKIRVRSLEEILFFFEEFSDKNKEIYGFELTINNENINHILATDFNLSRFVKIPENTSIKLIWDADDYSKLSAWSDFLGKHRTIIYLNNPEIKQVKNISLMGYNLILNNSIFNDQNQEKLNEIIDFYFHNECLFSSVEPFHSLFSTWISGYGLNIWQLYDEDPTLLRYVKENKEVFLSSRTADLNNNEIDSSYENIFLKDKECRYCSAFRLCRGMAKSCCPILSCAKIINLSKIFQEKINSIRLNIIDDKYKSDEFIFSPSCLLIFYQSQEAFLKSFYEKKKHKIELIEEKCKLN